MDKDELEKIKAEQKEQIRQIGREALAESERRKEATEKEAARMLKNIEEQIQLMKQVVTAWDEKYYPKEK